jgi:hypothetical protein
MSQQQPAANFKSFFRVLTIIHFAMIAGLMMITVLFMSSDGLGTLSFTQEPFEFLIPIVLVGAIFIGKLVSKTLLTKGIKNKTLQQKLGVYQTAHIVRIAPIEGIGFFAAVTYSTTNNLFFLLIVGLTLLMILTLMPTKEKIESAILMNSEDQVYLRNPDKVFES